MAMQAAAHRRGVRVIVVDSVVIGASNGQVVHIRLAAVLPRLEMVDLAFIGRIIAFCPRAGGVFGGGHQPLLFGSEPGSPIEVDWALEGMDEGDKADLGKLFSTNLAPEISAPLVICSVTSSPPPLKI